ncbi:3-isopropylmalate dehydratase small subunit [Ottowia thiooxydans]|uniref:3-isopropylmalate dehydratase small subunit n=1 Tax=Ottowia thiooxydans TaxID=219182 RepID=A0ABV2Q4U5_9BURK
MQPFLEITGVAAPLRLDNVDTDQITPGRVVTSAVGKSGFGNALFYNWRYSEDGSENAEFVLNREPYRRAKFLLAGANFGCGSSREIAVWAIRDFGIRAIIAPSFGSIFASNCYINGVLPITLDAAHVSSLAEAITAIKAQISVNLERQEIKSADGHVYAFHVPALQRERLLEGLDAIDATLKRNAAIAAFQTQDAVRRPWVYSLSSHGLNPYEQASGNPHAKK